MIQEVEIPKNSKVSLLFILGQDDNLDNVNRLIDKYTNLEAVEQSTKDVQEKWDQIKSKIKITTPDKKFNYLINNIKYGGVCQRKKHKNSPSCIFPLFIHPLHNIC